MARRLCILARTIYMVGNNHNTHNSYHFRGWEFSSCTPTIRGRKQSHVKLNDSNEKRHVVVLLHSYSIDHFSFVADITRASVDWLLNSRASFSRNPHGPITGLQNQRKKPYNKQRSVFTGKSQTTALPYWPSDAKVAV